MHGWPTQRNAAIELLRYTRLVDSGLALRFGDSMGTQTWQHAADIWWFD